MLDSEDSIACREIYYEDTALFGKQRNVDELVDDICACVGCEAHQLNVIAQAKGIFIGGLSLGIAPKRETARETLVPPVTDNEILNVHPHVKWVLILEKESIFHNFIGSDARDNAAFDGKTGAPKGIVITVCFTLLRDKDGSEDIWLTTIVFHPKRQKAIRIELLDTFWRDWPRPATRGEQESPLSRCVYLR